MLGAKQGCPGSQAGTANQQGFQHLGDKAQLLGKLNKAVNPAISAAIQGMVL